MSELRPESDEQNTFTVPAQLPPEILKLIVEAKLELDERMVQARIENMRREFLDSLMDNAALLLLPAQRCLQLSIWLCMIKLCLHPG